MNRNHLLKLRTLRTLPFALVTASLVLVGGCRNGKGGADEEETASGFAEDAGTGPTAGNGSATVGDDDGDTDDDDDDDDTGGPPGGSCDAGDEAFVKRLITLVHGRRPESIREVRLLVSMIEQLDALGEDGRRVVALGMSRGEPYLDRWQTHLFDELRINRVGDRRNDLCYDQQTSAGNASDLAAFIRDNGATADFGPDFYMPDVVRSALRLDDLSPAYRAEVFARMSAPLVAGNVDMVELEHARRINFGQSFEQAWLGRKTECNACHRSEFAVTYSPDPELNRHWPVPGGNFELAVYGPQAAAADENRSYAVFRHRNFAYSVADWVRDQVPAGASTAFGLAPACGHFRFPTGGQDILGHDPYLIDDFGGAGATIYQLDEELRVGFERLRTEGLMAEPNGDLEGSVAAAWLVSMNIANQTWREAMGYPLTVANNFPRNEGQRDMLHELTDTFVSAGYSLRALLLAITTHPYFNQATPEQCNADNPYYMPALFDPFTKESSEVSMRGNGIGDSVHRIDAWVMLDSVSQAMWWDKPERFGADRGETPGASCGQNMVNNPCDETPVAVEALRDLGAFLGDSEGGFDGTDLRGLLRLESEFGIGEDPQFGGDCTGPLGDSCAPGNTDFIDALMDVAADTPGADMWDLASALKDRLLTDPGIDSDAEANLLADVMGVAELSETVEDVGLGAAEDGLRRLVAVFVNAPQFVLAGVPAPDVDPAEDPILVVPGTSTAELCQFLAPLVLDNAGDGYQFSYTCDGDGITIE